MQYLYLFIDLASLSIPFIYSFHSRINFHKQFHAAIPAILFTALCFIIWDSAFTDRGVWGFNPAYISGLYLFNLPLEEVLFFICIPYACLFTYHCLTRFYPIQWKEHTELICCIFLITLLFGVGIVHVAKVYTYATCVSTAALLVIFRFIFMVKWMGRLLSVFAVLLIPFFIVNGLLTGTALPEPVVWYNEAENMGIRLHTIPLEDVIYGFELIMINVFFFEWLGSRKAKVRYSRLQDNISLIPCKELY